MNLIKTKLIRILAIASAFSLFLTTSTNANAFGETKVDGEYSVSLSKIKGAGYLGWLPSFERENYQSVANVTLTPGDNSDDLNLSWYSTASGTKPAVSISTSPDLSNAAIFTGSCRGIFSSTGVATYKSTNHVSIKNYLKENTTYYYRVTDNISAVTPTWSSTYSYRNAGKDDYSVLLVGDAQIGASDNVAADTYSWNETLEATRSIMPNPAFLLSLGDQVNYKSATGDKGLREQQYAGFLYPSLLRSLPVATVIGNHDSKGVAYSYHFNNPNNSKQYGKTDAGCDYYFARGNALFIILNTNNRNQASHRKLMKQAVAAYPDAKWRIVAFHHDVYGSGVLHSNRTGANLRIITAPLMDEFNIDLVFTGHDHSYARSYSMLDGTAIKTSSNTLVNPYGTTYVTLGSSSGSKMYGLASPKQYYVKERSNDLTPTFSTLSVSDDTLLLKTYNSSGKQYSCDFSITKTTDKTNPVSTYQKTNALKKTSYTKKSFRELQNALTEFKQKFAPTKTDSGIAKIQKGYGTSSDPLTYYGYMLGTTDVLSKGFSTLLDKTRYQGGKAINQTTLTNLTLHLENARNALVKTTLVVKKGKKKLKSGQTISLKKGKKLKLKVTKTPSKYKVTYTSANKKIVSVSKTGTIKRLKRHSKKTKITVTFQNRKFYLYIK